MSEKMLDIKEYMYRFLQEPTREKFIDLVFDGVGEQDSIDFKKKWIESQKLSEIILGMANTGGGVVIFGVEEKEDEAMPSCTEGSFTQIFRNRKTCVNACW